MPHQDQERVIAGEVVVNALLDQMWHAWTSSEGADIPR